MFAPVVFFYVQLKDPWSRVSTSVKLLSFTVALVKFVASACPPGLTTSPAQGSVASFCFFFSSFMDS